MSFSIYQLPVPIFALVMMLKAISRFLRGIQTVRELIAWIVIWGSISFIALFPDLSMHWLSTVTGIKSGVNALIFFALVVLFYGMLRLAFYMEENERKLTELVRKIALEKFSNTLQK